MRCVQQLFGERVVVFTHAAGRQRATEQPGDARKSVERTIRRIHLHAGNLAQQAAFDVAPPGRRLLAVGTAYVDFAVAHPHVFQLVYSRRAPGDDPHLDEAVTQHVGLLRAAVADAVEAGALTADAERADVESAVWSLAHGLAHLAASGFLTCEQAPAILAALLGGGDRAA